MRILTVFGTRPEAIKLAPVIHALRAARGVDALVCTTGQHKELLEPLLDYFDLHPDARLDVMKTGQSLAELTSALLLGLDPLMKKIQPDWVLVQGDTTTAMAGALCAFYHQLRVGHVEAGLRTRERWQPFPEEINRRIAGVTAELHFAPTETARQNLLAEGIDPARVILTGNTAIDTLQMALGKTTLPRTREILDWIGTGEGRRLALVTAHRRENQGQGLESICAAIRAAAQAYGGQLRFVYPVHRNPQVLEPVQRLLGGLEHVLLTEPLEYPVMAQLLGRAWMILTDSGGIQEEATSLGKPTLVLREVTERPEGLEAGVLRLTGTDPRRIRLGIDDLMADSRIYASMAKPSLAFGDGRAAQRIVRALIGI